MSLLPYKFSIDEILKQNRTTQENIDTIKTWLNGTISINRNDYNFIPINIQDQLIVIFLLSCDNDLPLTKNTIIMYYKCKQKSPDIFNERYMNRSDLMKAMNTVHMSSIPQRTDEGYVVHFFKLNDTTYSNFDLTPVMKLSYMLLDIAQEKDLPTGLIVLIDMKGMNLMHLTRLRMRAIKNYVEFLQEGFPLQMKMIHIINTVHFIDKIMAIVKLVMKSELISLIKFHPPNISPEQLFQFVPKKCLPAEYGGDLPSEVILHEKTMEQFKEKEEFWRMEQEMRQN